MNYKPKNHLWSLSRGHHKWRVQMTLFVPSGAEGNESNISTYTKNFVIDGCYNVCLNKSFEFRND